MEKNKVSLGDLRRMRRNEREVEYNALVLITCLMLAAFTIVVNLILRSKGMK